MIDRTLVSARNPAVPRPVLLPLRVPPVPVLSPGPGEAGPAGLAGPSESRPSNPSPREALPALPGWHTVAAGSLSRLFSFPTAGCAASFACRVLALTTAEPAPVRCVLAKEGSFVRVTALVPEGGWSAAAWDLLAELERLAAAEEERS